MKNLLVPCQLAAVLCLLLPAACATSPERAHPLHRAPGEVKVSTWPGGRLKLSFDPAAPPPAWGEPRPEEVRAVLAALHDSLPPAEQSRLRLVLASTGPLSGGAPLPAEWERRLKEEYLSRYGPPLIPLPESLENDPLVLALKLSPRYMGAGVRDAALELFSSPAFLTSVALSVAVYFAAWLAPEPVFTKALVAALTVRLSLAVGALELGRVAWACLLLYRESHSARTVAELEAAAEHFGRAMGGSALRVLMLVASFGVGKALPQVPEGGLQGLLEMRAPRYSVPGGLTLGGSTTVQMVADGSIVLSGAAVGTLTSALGSACGDGSQKKDGHQWHHIATNKNDTSTAQGGPWTPVFLELFLRAGMSLDDPANLIYLNGHQGPHPAEYHSAIYSRLEAALGNCETMELCRSNLMQELRMLAEELCTPGSLLHQLATKSQGVSGGE